MPVRLITFIVTLLVIVTFIGFNIDNKSDIRYWFGENGILHDVPIFVSFFIMYLIGVVSVIPFLLRWKMKKRQKKGKAVDAENEEIRSEKKVRVLGGKRAGSEPESSTGESPDTSSEEMKEKPAKSRKRRKSAEEDSPEA